jgi:hypothetical protein
MDHTLDSILGHYAFRDLGWNTIGVIMARVVLRVEDGDFGIVMFEMMQIS